MVRKWLSIHSFKILLVIVLFSITSGLASAEWTLKFTERDLAGGYSNQYKGYSALYVLVDDRVVESYPTLSGDYNYGRQTIDLTPYVTEGKSRVSFKLEGRRQGLLLYDIEVLHDGKPVKFTPWSYDKSDPRVRCLNYSETRLVIMLGIDLDQNVNNFGVFTSAPLQDSPDLEVKQSDLTFGKPIYKILDGDNVQVNVTVRNLGVIAEKGAHLELYVDDISHGKSENFNLESGQSITQSFNLPISFNKNKFLKVRAVIIPSNSNLEGRTDNNQAVKYIVRRPYLFFTDINQTPVKMYWGQSPYTGWVSELEYGLTNCMAYDYSSPNAKEDVKSDCLARLALHYQLTGDESYAEKAREGLTHIGDGAWSWVDRTKAGSAKKGSLNKGVNENYGLSSVFGATWGKTLFQYSLAYDWTHNYAVEYDDKHGTSSIEAIRDKLARMTTDSYLLLKELYSYGDFGTGISAFAFGDYGTGRLALEGPFGVAAMTLLDYDGQYQDTDGNPEKWIRFVETDLAVESQTGAKRSNLDQHISRDGLYEEGSGYRAYYEPSISFFVALYNNVLGENMAKKYPLVDGYMKDVPLTMSPTGRYPNLCVSYASVWYDVANSLMVYDKGTPEHSIINYYIQNVILQPKGYRGESGSWGTFYDMLFYDKDEPAAPPKEPSYFSPYGSMNVLRSGWESDSLYAFMKAPSEPTMSGHAPMEFHQLTFDIWAKGAYPVVDAGDARFLRYGSSNAWGHTTWLVYEDGKERWIDRDTKGQYGATCNNPAYITSKLASQDINFVKGEMKVKNWFVYPNSGEFKNPFHATRDLAMVDGRYFIAYDSLRSDGKNDYSMLIPFGSANGHTGDKNNPNDNWALGELDFDGRRMPWFDYSANQPVAQDVPNVTELVWETVTETNNVERNPSPVNMTVHFNPSARVTISTASMHYGSYGQDYEWAIPVAGVRQTDSDVRYLTVYYPTGVLDEIPTIRNLDVVSDDKKARATEISLSAVEDIAIGGDGPLATAKDVTTNARLTIVERTSGKLNFVFMEGGTGIMVSGDTVMSTSGRVTSSVRFNPENITGSVDSPGPFTLFLKASFDGNLLVSAVKFNGMDIPYAYDGANVRVELPGSGSLEVIASENGSVNSQQTIIIPQPVGLVREVPTTTLQPILGQETSTTSRPFRVPANTVVSILEVAGAAIGFLILAGVIIYIGRKRR